MNEKPKGTYWGLSHLSFNQSKSPPIRQQVSLALTPWAPRTFQSVNAHVWQSAS